MRFSDLPQFPLAHYEMDADWNDLERHVATSDPPLVMCPDYQRGHVWTREQQIAFVEYGLMGGESSMVITTNCPGWMEDFRGPYELVDGLQRVTAVLAFLRNEIPVFGEHTFRDFTDRMRCFIRFKWRIMNLPTRADVLNLYLLINGGGVVHPPEEIARVRKLLEEERRHGKRR